MKILLAVEDFRCAETVRKAVIAQFKTDNTEVRLVHALEPFPVGLAQEMGGRDSPDFVAAQTGRSLSHWHSRNLRSTR